MEQHENPFPLAPSPGWFVGSVTLMWLSAVTVRTEAVSNNTVPVLHEVDFCPLNLFGTGLDKQATAQCGQSCAFCWDKGRSVLGGDSEQQTAG